jgi:hypothetical protein
MCLLSQSSTKSGVSTQNTSENKSKNTFHNKSSGSIIKEKCKKSKGKKRMNARRGTINNFVKRESMEESEFVQRQMTMENSKTFIPVLKSLNADLSNVGVISKSGISSLNKNSKESLGQTNLKQAENMLNTCQIPVRKHERTPSFLKHLPDKLKITMAQENTERDENLDKFLGLIGNRNKSHDEGILRRNSSNHRESLLQSTRRKSSYLVNQNRNENFLFNSRKRSSFINLNSKDNSTSEKDPIDDTPTSSIENEELMDEINEEDEKEDPIQNQNPKKYFPKINIKPLNTKVSTTKSRLKNLKIPSNQIKETSHESVTSSPSILPPPQPPPPSTSIIKLKSPIPKKKNLYK